MSTDEGQTIAVDDDLEGTLVPTGIVYVNPLGPRLLDWADAHGIPEDDRDVLIEAGNEITRLECAAAETLYFMCHLDVPDDDSSEAKTYRAVLDYLKSVLDDGIPSRVVNRALELDEYMSQDTNL